MRRNLPCCRIGLRVIFKMKEFILGLIAGIVFILWTMMWYYMGVNDGGAKS